MNNDENISFADLRAFLAESAIEFDRKLADSQAAAEKRNADFERKLVESQEAFDLRMQKLNDSSAKTENIVKNLAQQLGGMGNSNGAAAVDFFYNSFLYGPKNIFGENFDDVFKEEKRKTKKGGEDEYDILMFNGQAVCIVEVKYKADTDDIPGVLKKVQTFRMNFPEHSDKKLYLALASMSFHSLTEKACKDNGIAIVKQVGDTIVINDKHLKAF